MGRPTASQTNRGVALAFAQMVSEKSEDPNDIIARSGSFSMYAALQATCPFAVRSGRREGITEVEFNKVLQVRRPKPIQST